LASSCTNNDCAKSKGRISAQQRSIKTGCVGLLIEWTLHESIRNHADNGPPRLRFTGIINPNASPDRAFVAPIFSRETGIDDRHRLFGVRIINSEVTAFQYLQPERPKIIVRNEFVVSARSIAVLEIVLAVHLVLTLAIKGHPKTAAQSDRIELRIGPQDTQRATKKFLSGIQCWICAFHQGHAGRVNGLLIVTII